MTHLTSLARMRPLFNTKDIISVSNHLAISTSIAQLFEILLVC